MLQTIGVMRPELPVTKAAPVRRRTGFTLVETMIALVILAGVVLGMAMSTLTFSRGVRSSDAKSRAQAKADMQIARARAWSSYATLSSLSGPQYNVTEGGLAPTTVVTVDTTRGINITVVQVTINGTTTGVLPAPIVRKITIAAP
jgi:prepilin-type N-terminal cleavage/methylation domain-containing protein